MYLIKIPDVYDNHRIPITYASPQARLRFFVAEVENSYNLQFALQDA